MKKLITIILLFSSISFGQGIKVGLTGGLVNFMAPDQFTKSIQDGGFGFKNSFGFGLKGKFEIPLIPLSANASINYIPLSSKKNSIEIKSNILSLGVGAEWSFIPGPLSPYASLDLLFNSFGELEIKTPLGTLKEKSFTRNGIAIGGGISFTLLPVLDFDLSAKYAYYNLLGAKNGEKANTSLNIMGTIYYNIL
mgnify:CR=1 FL=1